MKKSELHRIRKQKQNIKTEGGEPSPPPKKQKQRIDWDKIRELKNLPRDKKDEWMDRKAAQIRSRYLKTRWCFIYPDKVGDNIIDMSIDRMRLEWLLCDPRILFRLKHRRQKKRMEGLNMLPEDLQPLYLYGTDPAGKKYTDIQTGKIFKAMNMALGRVNEKDFVDINEDEFNAYMESELNEEDTEDNTEDNEQTEPYKQDKQDSQIPRNPSRQ